MTAVARPAVAIIGQACRFPGADDPAALWQAVHAGRALADPGPTPAPRLETLGPAPPWARPESLPGELRVLDRLFGAVYAGAREALRDARYEPTARRAGIRSVLFVGNQGIPTSRLAALAPGQAPGPGGAGRPGTKALDRFASGLPALLAARHLGLDDALTLEAACASSLYALKLACDALHDGGADLAIAGGVQLADPALVLALLGAVQATSPSGRSRPFHRDADGIVPAEGLGFVVLRRLEDAFRAQDRILGLVRGVGLSNDGNRATLLTPDAGALERAMRSACAEAGLAPAAIGYMACHATGTAAGDPVELAALGRLLGPRSGMPVGSVKAIIGHPLAAAGMASLLVALEGLRRRQIPPTPHADAAHAAVAQAGLRLPAHAQPWDGPLAAGVTAAGFGGCNAHAVIEAYPSTSGATTRSFAVVPSPRPPAGRARVDLAVTGLAVRAADGSGTTDFARVLFGAGTRLRPTPLGQAAPAAHLDIRLDGLRFPPQDLARARPSHAAVLEVARLAGRGRPDLASARTLVIVAAASDAQTGRLVGDGQPQLTAAQALGQILNLSASRIARQFDIGGAAYVVSSEERSGLDALALARRAIAAGQADAALVAGADFAWATPPAVSAALAADRRQPGDAAVALLVEPLEAARRAGRTILAVLADDADEAGVPDAEFGLADGAWNLTPLVGHAHAASGLMHVAAGVLACHYRRLPAGLGARAGVSNPARAGDRLALRIVVAPLGAGTPGQISVSTEPGQPPPAGFAPLDAADFDRPRVFLPLDGEAPAADLGGRVDEAAGAPDALRARGGVDASPDEHTALARFVQTHRVFLDLRRDLHERFLALASGLPLSTAPLAAPPMLAGASRADGPPLRPHEAETILDPARDEWLRDHCPTYDVATLPMTCMLDRLAEAARACGPGRAVVGLHDVRLSGWVTCGEPRRLRTTAVPRGERVVSGRRVEVVEATLAVFRAARTAALSRFEVVARGEVLLAADYDGAQAAAQDPPPAATVAVVADPYVDGNLFHGPALRFVRRLAYGAQGYVAQLEAGAGRVPVGTIHPGLLDGALHGMCTAWHWLPGVEEQRVLIPIAVRVARFFAATPRCGAVEARARALATDAARRSVSIRVDLRTAAAPWAALEVEFVLLQQFPFSRAVACAWWRDRSFVPGVGVSRFEGQRTRARPADIAALDWLPDAVAARYGLPGGLEPLALAEAVAVKDHAAQRLGVHPGRVGLDERRRAYGLPGGGEPTRVHVRHVGADVVVDDLQPSESFQATEPRADARAEVGTRT